MSEDTFHLGVKALIRSSEGNVLLLQVNKAMLRNEQAEYWDLPGGRVQRDQTVEDTLRREVAEETGIQSLTQISEIGMVLSNIRIPITDNMTVGLVLAIYSCVAPNDSAIQLSSEHVAWDWCSPIVAAERLAVKYPKSFCDLIAQLQ